MLRLSQLPCDRSREIHDDFILTFPGAHGRFSIWFFDAGVFEFVYVREKKQPASTEGGSCFSFLSFFSCGAESLSMTS